MKIKAYVRAIAILLALMTCLPILASCSGETPETPDSSESTAETTVEPPEIIPEKEMIEIIAADKSTSYTIIRPDSGNDTATDAASELFSSFLKAGVSQLKISTDHRVNPVSDFEILVGKTARELPEGVFLPDELLGANDFIIKVIEKRVQILAGGSAISTACETFFKIWKDGEALSLPEDYMFVYKAGRNVGELTVAGSPATDYTIVASPSDALVSEAAEKLQKALFDTCGAIVPVSAEAPANGKCMTLSVSDSAKSFSLSVSSGNVTVTSSPAIGLCRGIRDFAELLSQECLADKFDMANGYKYETYYGDFVTYEQFGAKGDGVTDDIDAIVAAHADANTKGVKVLAKEGATYYIGGAAKPVTIETDTDWSTARFIIDDRAVESQGLEVFRVPAPKNGTSADLSGLKTLKAGAASIGITLPYDAMLIIRNDNVRQFIRKGANQDSGQPMCDLILVDKNGSIDPSTPVIWDFDEITYATAIPMVEKTLTLRGGVFTTYDNAKKTDTYKSFHRGIRISRSNTVVDGMTHIVEKEGNVGSPYYGFISVTSSNNVTVRNCVFTGHKTFKDAKGTSMGTYDLYFDSSTHLKVENCTQTNEITDSKYWGVFASNSCKNIEFDSCVFSRFDAHRGVTNLTLRNCEFGHQGVNLIGHGTALIENTTVRAKQFINLRNDYGSTFNGDVTIRSCTYVPSSSGDIVLINGSNTGDWDFGYTCHLINGLTIDGLEIKSSSKNLYIYKDITPKWDGDVTKLPHAPVVPKLVTLGNITANGKAITAKISKNTAMFGATEIQKAE